MVEDQSSIFAMVQNQLTHLLKVWAILISRNPTHLQCQYYQNIYFGQSKIICNLHEPGWLVQGCHWAEVHLFLNGMHTGNFKVHVNTILSAPWLELPHNDSWHHLPEVRVSLLHSCHKPITM